MRQKNVHKQNALYSVARQTGCPVCSAPFSGGIAYFSFGAVVDLAVFEKKKLSHSIMEGFCFLGYHGVDPAMVDSVNYFVADGIKGGQLDIEFCSLACLRQWFCDIVDDLEEQLRKQTSGKPDRCDPADNP